MPQLYDSLLERMEGQAYSRYFSCCCPYHSDSKPSMLVFSDGFFKCLGCGEHGTHAKLDKKIGSHFIPTRVDTASKFLPHWRSWERKYGTLEEVAYVAHKNVNVTYLKRRKIYEFLDEGYLGCLDGWITFPVFDRRHTILDIVVRSTSRNSGRVRYGVSPSVAGTHPLYVPSWQKIEQSDTVYVPYGIVDAISIHLAGLPAVTGTTGKSLSAELLRLLNKRFVIVPDDGEEKEAYRLANQLGWRASVKLLKYDDCKDPDEVRMKFDNQYLLDMLGA